jgi:hypothetical protein
MKRFGEWVATRRKSVRYPRQQDFSNETGLSVATLANIEQTGEWDSRSRATKALLAYGLRTTVSDLDRLARGEVDDVPVHGRGSMDSAPASAADALVWFSNQSFDVQDEVLGQVEPEQAIRVGEATMRRMRAALFSGRRAPTVERVDQPGRAPGFIRR